MASTAFDLARGLLAHTLTCDQVRAELSGQPGLPGGPADLVHFLEHYIADQDIRERDRGYADWQEAELRKMLAPGEGE